MKFLILALLISGLNLSATECELWYISGQTELDDFYKSNPNCDTLTGNLTISFSPEIVDLSPLKNITTIIGDLTINGSPTSGNLRGLESLQTVTGDLIIEYLNTKSLEGLESLNEVGDGIEIKNSELETLNGLDSLKTVGRYISIQVNNNLTDILTLNSNIVFLNEIPGIVIYKNPNLSICNSGLICSRSFFNTSLMIEKNAEGCNSWDEVKESCLQSSINEISDLNKTYTFIEKRKIKLDWLVQFNDIQIFNMLGKDYTDGITFENNTIDLTNLEKGFYIFSIDGLNIKIFND